MVGTQNPRNMPPAEPLEHQGSVGKVHGLQSSERWLAGEYDSRQIVDQRLAANLWRVSVICSEWMRLNLIYGTSRGVEIKNVEGPLVFYAPGQLAIYATPIAKPSVGFVAGYAYATCTPASSAGASNCRKLVSGAQALDDNAARFYALDAATVQLGSAGPAVALTLGQSVPLIAGSSLTAGDGYLEFEP